MPSLSLHGQSPSSLTVDVREVTVDVAVYDSSGYLSRGKPVSGLQQSDFMVYEDGKQKAIKSFVEHHGLAGAGESLSPTLIVLDDASSDLNAQSWARSEVKRFLQSAPAGPIAIAALTPGLCFVHGFTTDPSTLLAALDRVGDCTHIHASPFLQSSGEQQTYQQQAGQIRDAAEKNPQVAGMADQLERMQENMLQVQAQQLTSNTLSAFAALAGYLSAFPGRKNLVWLAQNFTTRPFGEKTEEDPEFRRAAGLLTAARVAVYPIDDGGLAAPYGLSGIASLPAHSAPKAEKAISDQRIEAALQRNAFTQTMDEVADRTGGEAFYNTNGIAAAISRVVNNADSYYTLTYRPAESGQDVYHRISVRLSRSIGTHRLAYRRGYSVTDLPESALRSLLDPAIPNLRQIHYRAAVRRSRTTWTPDPLGASILRHRAASDLPSPSGSLVLAGENHALTAKPYGKVRRFYFDLAVASSDLRFHTNVDGSSSGSLDFAVVAYDLQGNAINWFHKHFTPNVSDKDRDQIDKVGIQLSEDLDLPPGKYLVRLGIADLFSGKSSTTQSEIDNTDPL